MVPAEIEDHAVVGDLRTVAVIATDACVDSLCLPDVDSPSVFAALLDADCGGHLRCDIDDLDDGEVTRRRQQYLPDTNVLLTRLLAAGSTVEVTDLMPPSSVVKAVTGSAAEGVLVRRVHVLRGAQRVRIECWPGFDYARADHRAEISGDGRLVVFRSAAGTLTLRSSVPLVLGERARGAAASAVVALDPGSRIDLVVSWGEPLQEGPRPDDAEALESATVDFWRHWLSGCRYEGRWREAVSRSALCLKLLQHAPTGGIVASPSFGLPEWAGGERNWDYRYVWLRDAAFVVFAMLRLGFRAEAEAFAGWLSERFATIDGGEGLRPVYRVDGSPPPEEQNLDHLRGYRDSRPVRIGNGAFGQVQLDVLGEVMDGLYLFDRVQPIGWELWEALGVQLSWLAEHWQDPDAGLWESRGRPEQYVYSKVMVWVAFERALRLARRRGLPADRDRWQAVADEAYRWVQDTGWDAGAGAYVQRLGSRRLDAALLVLPLVRFAGATDPRVLATLDLIGERLGAGSLLRRYETEDGDDGVTGPEGTFTLCSFWYAESLARAGRLDAARFNLEKTLTYANQVGLFSEQIGPQGEALGNFPQALTHLAMISCATTLDRLLPG